MNKEGTEITEISGDKLKELLAGGLANLKLNSKRIDELNVFPIPDGDTGKNMTKTMSGGMDAVSGADTPEAGGFMKKFARGALLGARGNSGVILSQFFKGFETECEDAVCLDAAAFTAAFKAGVDRTYKAVVNPVEGTILTVMREGYEYIRSKKSVKDFREYFRLLNKKMSESLDNTPNLLPILKESGVIDSGGAGFLAVFEGMEKVLNGESPAEEAPPSLAKESRGVIDKNVFNADSVLEFGYCTEFILQLMNDKTDIRRFDLDRDIIDYLNGAGDSVVAITDDDLVKVHVHTFRPGEVLNYAQKYGEFITLKIENMQVQHNESSLFRKLPPAAAETEEKTPAWNEGPAPNKEKQPSHKAIAVVAVTSGDGIRDLFTEMGVDVCVDGGQTNNPSTEDFIKAFDSLSADNIIVLPGNSNIVMAASQAAKLYEKASVHVVEAKTLSESYSAVSMMCLDDGDAARVIDEMRECIDNVATGLITTSIRDVAYENISVAKGHFIGMYGKKVVSDSPDRLEAVRALLENMNANSKDVLTIFYGESVPDEETLRLGEIIEKDFSHLEYGFVRGGQKVYDYIIAAE